MSNGNAKYRALVDGDQRFHIKIAYGLARTYRIAQSTLESLDKQKQQVWSLIRREIENARDPDSNISLTDMRSALEIGSDAPDEWWECGIAEIRARDQIEATYFQAAKRQKGKDEVRAIDPEKLVPADSDDSSEAWFESTNSTFVTFGRKYIKAQMAVELFAEKLKNWIFFDGESYHQYSLDFYRHVGGHLQSETTEIPHLCDFILMFMDESYEEQVTIIERITRDLHKTRAGTEILRAFVNENRSIWPGAQRASEITTDDGNTVFMDLNEFGSNDPRTHNTWGEPDRNLFGNGPAFNGGLNLLCLFDKDRRVNGQFANYKSGTGRSKGVISDTGSSSQTFVEHQGSGGSKLVVSGKGKSAALTLIAQRLMVGTSRVVGIESRDAGGDPETKAVKPVGVTLDTMFTDEFITDVLNVSIEDLENMKEGKTGNLSRPGRRTVKYTNLKSTEKWTHGEKLFQQGQTTWGYFASIGEGFTQFNAFIQNMRDYGGSLGGTADMNAFQRKAITLSNTSGTDANMGSIVEKQPWIDVADSYANALGAFVTSVSGLSLVGEMVVLGDKKDWSFSDSFAMVGQLSEFYEAIDDIGPETAGGASKVSGRIITQSTTEVIGVVGDLIEVGMSVQRVDSHLDAGDVDAAVAAGLEAGLASGGAIATAITIFSGGTAAAVGGMIAAAAAVGGMMVAFVAWVLGVDEPAIVDWARNTYFGSNWGNGDYGSVTSKWYRFQFRGDAGYDDEETSSRVAFGRQISAYMTIKVPFTVSEAQVTIVNQTKKGVIELRAITKGSARSDLIVCPIAEDSGRPAYPLHVIHLGFDKQTSHDVEIHADKNRTVTTGDQPVWVTDPEKEPPGEVWAWHGTMEATGNADYQDFFAAPVDENSFQYRLRADDYANTGGVEFIHVPGGLNKSLLKKIENASTESQTTDEAKDVVAIIDELPYPRQRVMRSQLSLPGG